MAAEDSGSGSNKAQQFLSSVGLGAFAEQLQDLKLSAPPALQHCHALNRAVTPSLQHCHVLNSAVNPSLALPQHGCCSGCDVLCG